MQTSAVSHSPVTLSYDASSGNYTVSTEGRSQTFGTSDEQAQRWAGERRFSKSAASEHLTLATTPYFNSGSPNKYVGMGYWQRNAIGGGVQQTYFSTFTYGFDTAASAMPRTGAAHWLTDVFGALSTPGKEIQVVQGLGDFTVDFADGTFLSNAYMNESNVVTNGGVVGSLRLSAGGRLDSGSGFSGLLSYKGSGPLLNGTIAGSFYGPNADEIGASFSASGGGTTLNGAMTGQRSSTGATSDGVPNISLTNLLVDQKLGGRSVAVRWTETSGKAGFSSLVRGSSSGGFEYSLASGPGTLDLDSDAYYTFKSSDITAAGAANFTTYQSTFTGNPLTVRRYKVGAGNSEIALTYTGFVDWRSIENGAIPTGETTKSYLRKFLVYGIGSNLEAMTSRTGQASYNGVVYGTGANMRGSSYDVSGTSHFAVDFSASSYNGWLMMVGTDQSGASSDFGQWTFADVLSNGAMAAASLRGPGSYDPGSIISPIFYGPTGQEIGATFYLGMGWPKNEDSIEIVGVALAKE